MLMLIYAIAAFHISLLLYYYCEDAITPLYAAAAATLLLPLFHYITLWSPSTTTGHYHIALQASFPLLPHTWSLSATTHTQYAHYICHSIVTACHCHFATHIPHFINQSLLRFSFHYYTLLHTPLFFTPLSFLTHTLHFSGHHRHHQNVNVIVLAVTAAITPLRHASLSTRASHLRTTASRTVTR